MGVFAQASQQTGGGVFSQAAAQAQKPGAFGGVSSNSFTGNVAKNVATQYGSAVKSAFNSGINTSSNAIVDSQKGKNPLETGAQFGAGVVGAAFSPLAPIFSPVGTLINQLGDKISDIPQVQKFANLPVGIGVARGVDFGNNLNTILGAVAGGPGAKTGASAVNLETPRVFPTPVGSGPKAVVSLAKEWAQPTQTVTASFNKAKAVLAKDPNTPKFLAEQGIDPRAHIEDGRYVTEDTAQSLRDTAGKMSADTLRPSLQAADYSTPPTSIAEIQANAVRRVASDNLTTAADKDVIISRINKEAEALKATYPNGLKLTDMHDNKITYAKNGGYSPIKSASDNNIATANRLLGQAFEDVGTAKTPTTVPVRDFRAYLQQYYRAADYLDELNTKKAPVTLGQSIARSAAKYGGAAIGSSFGGDVVSAFAGYSIGKALEHALENMNNPMRAAFIRNIEQTNPEAAVKVREYLAKQSSGNTGTPRLPEASAIQLPPAPIRGRR